jgi:hypothetical protein
MTQLIKSPFGEIDLDYPPIEFLIKDSSLGSIRKVRYEGILHQSETGQFAEILWNIWQFDAEGNLISSLDAVQGRQVSTLVSGQNKVSADGILILRELFPEGEIGDRAYRMAWSSGCNEYKYWMALLRVAPLATVITLAGQMLAQFERFDRQ